MAVVWIVTTGNSDVKLTSDDGWRDLRTKKNEQLKPCQKKGFSSLIKGDDNLFSLPARAMGILYGDTWKTHEAYFKFPLLEEFRKFIKKPENENKYPDRIIVLLTNQEKIFLEDSDNFRYNRAEDSPYWRDTTRLELIFKHYFDREFGEGKVLFPFPVLEPETREKGLDNWDSTLKLVQKEVEKWNISNADLVIVSHQASTPAISSAIQFVSLAKFGEKANFLIANERDGDLTRFLEGSEYLKGIRKKEAEALLKSHNYSGVKDLLDSYLKDERYRETRILLEAAIQWNFAKFDEFANEIQKLLGPGLKDLVQETKERSQHWWWIGYEAAYLAFIRLDQKNAVEAFFHGFRAVEGLISKWAEIHFSEHIDPNNDSPKLKASILEVPNLNYLGKSKYAEHKAKLEQDGFVILSGFPLYALLRSAKPNWKKDCKEITDFIEKIAPTRNKVFHRLRGLEIDDVFEAWLIDRTKAIEEKKLILEEKISKYLNFVSKQNFKSLKGASLMVQVHKELVSAIAAL